MKVRVNPERMVNGQPLKVRDQVTGQFLDPNEVYDISDYPTQLKKERLRQLRAGDLVEVTGAGKKKSD